VFFISTLQGTDQFRRGHTYLLSEWSLQAVEGITTLHFSEHGAVMSLRLQASFQFMASSTVSAEQGYSKAVGPKLECSTLTSIIL